MNLAIMASGRGSNAEAILHAVEQGTLTARVTALICDREDAGALDVAYKHNVTSYVVPREQFASRQDQQERMLELLRAANTEFIALAGFNAILRPSILSEYPNRILNIHPSLLPAFGGGIAPEPQAEALRAGVKISGCTVHLVTAIVDSGPIVAQAAVPVMAKDTVESLSARILKQEHRIYPIALQWFATNHVTINHGNVSVDSGVSQALWPNNVR